MALRGVHTIVIKKLFKRYLKYINLKNIFKVSIFITWFKMS